jgi:hypothetical protein
MTISGARSGKIQRLAQALHRDLAAYAIAASAAGVSMMALLQPSEAQIIYTPTNKTISSGEKLLIDFNHDGVTDLVVREFQCSLGTGFGADSLQAVPQRGGGGVVSGSHAAALPMGSKIGGSRGFYNRPAFMAIFTFYGVYYFGSWAFAPTSYLGAKFSIDGEVHYGWARLKVLHTYRNITANLTGFAYETQPDRPIGAGDMGENDADAQSGIQSSPTPSAKSTGSLGGLALGAVPPRPNCLIY